MKLGVPEIVLILVVVAVLFGTNKLPQVAKSIGNALGGFRAGMSKAQKGEDLFTEEDGEKLKETAAEAANSMAENVSNAASNAASNVSEAMSTMATKVSDRVEAVRENYDKSGEDTQA